MFLKIFKNSQENTFSWPLFLQNTLGSASLYHLVRALFLDLYSSSLKGQKGRSQNGCFKKTKHAKFSEKRTFLTPWYAQWERGQMRKRRICNLLPTITNLLSLARFATPKNIGEPLDLWFSNVFMGYVDVFMFSGEAGGG